MAKSSFHSKVAGVTASNADGYPRQKYIRSYCKPGMALILKREPANPHDNNAIGVWVTARALVVFSSEAQIGYLSADVAREVAPYMDKGGKITAKISDVTGGTTAKPTFGVNIEVTMA